jgi:hypothetical protein
MTIPQTDDWLLAGATLSARLLPMVAASPWMLDSGARALTWAELLLSEDPTSPDVLEVVALIFGRAGRPGGTELMLMELAYYSPDRAAGLARGAVVWQRLGRTRQECAQWLRAARWRDDPEDPVWRAAIACARRDPGAADWREIRDYVVARARPERRDAVAAELDGRPAPAPTGVGRGRRRRRGTRPSTQAQLMQVVVSDERSAALSGRWHGAGRRASVPALRGEVASG